MSSRAQRLRAQLRGLQIRQMVLHDRWLAVEIVALERELRTFLASDPEPLPKLLAQLQLGQISPQQAGHAIARDLNLASEVLQMAGTGANFAGADISGPVTIGNAAGRDIINIYIGPPYGH